MNSQIISALLGERLTADKFLLGLSERPFEMHGSIARYPEFLRSSFLTTLSQLIQHFEGSAVINRGSHTPFTFTVPIQKGKMGSLLSMGFAAQLLNSEKCLPGAAPFLSKLAAELGISESVLRFAVFASCRDKKQGLPFHFDGLDVLVIQTKGRKVFYLASNKHVKYPEGYQLSPSSRPTELHFPQFVEKGFPQRGPSKFRKYVLKAGSVLTIPRGTWHRTEASEDSISVNIGFEFPSGIGLLIPVLQKLLLQAEEWRAPFNGTSHKFVRRKELTRMNRLMAKLTRVVPRLSAENCFPSDISKVDGAFKPHLRFMTSSGFFLSYARVKGGNYRISIRSRHLDLLAAKDAPSLELRVSKDTMFVVRWIELRAVPFTVKNLFSAFPGAEESSLVALLKRMVGMKLVHPLQFPTYPRVK